LALPLRFDRSSPVLQTGAVTRSAREACWCPRPRLCPDRVAAAIRPSLTAARLGTAHKLWLVGVLRDVPRTSLVGRARS